MVSWYVQCNLYNPDSLKSGHPVNGTLIFHTKSVPAVRKKLTELNLPPKALLFLDKAPGTQLILKVITIKYLLWRYLPTNCTPLIQSMDQHLIQAVKLFCRKNSLRKIIGSATGIPKSLKSIYLKNVVFFVTRSIAGSASRPNNKVIEALVPSRRWL